MAIIALMIVTMSISYVNYTRYNISCHMVFHVTMVAFWMTLLINK